MTSADSLLRRSLRRYFSDKQDFPMITTAKQP